MHTQTGADIAQAVALLQAGEVVALPTETVYGLAANAMNPEAVARIFEAKKRPSYNPLILHPQSAEAAFSRAVSIPQTAYLLAAQFWPGPLTLLLARHASVPDAITAGSPRVALRVPAHPLFQQVLTMIDFPLAAPSANIFGSTSPTTAAHVAKSLNGRIPYILDGGTCAVGIESTIIGFEGETPVIYRNGAITRAEIEHRTGKEVLLKTQPTDHPVAPGMLRSHYAPEKKLYLGNVETLYQQHRHESPVLIVFKEKTSAPIPQIVLSENGSLEEAARRLYAALHAADELPGQVILVEEMPATGSGIALNDRLYKASCNS